MKKSSTLVKSGSTLFLKSVIVLIALIVLLGLLGFPHLEGRNANADLVTIYLRDPFLAYVYLASVPFFVALFQGIRLLGNIERNKAFSLDSVVILKNIKYCAITIGVMIVGIMPFAFSFAQDDDAPEIVAIPIVIIFACFVIATFAAVLERLLQNAAELKSENDLTV